MSDSGPGRREVAHRLFAAEFDDAEFSYSESDEERAPNYVVTPTGARANRLFAVGVLTEVEDVNPEMVRGRVVDPTGAFVTYAGQYQPEALAFLERADPPTFLALSGKARTFEPDDGDRIYTSVRPESVSEVDAETRDRAAVVAAERTLERIGVMASAIESGLEGDGLRAALGEAGVEERLADGVALALDYYGTTPAYLEALRELAIDVARVVAGEMDEVSSLDVAPGEGAGDAGPLATLELSAVSAPGSESATVGDTREGTSTAASPAEGGAEGPEASTADADADDDESAAGGVTTSSPTTSDPDVETGADVETGSTAAAGAEPDETAATESEPDTGAVSGTDPAPSDAGETDGDPSSEPGAEGAGEPVEESATDDVGAEPAEDEPGDFDPGEFELDEEERREVEEEYGTEFSTADEVEDADVGSPAPETASDEGAETAAESASEVEAGTGAEPELEPEAEAGTEPEPETAAETEAEPDSEVEPESEPEPEPEVDATTEDEAEGAGEAAEDVDLEDAVVETMESLDDGDGADHDEVVASVVDEYGADPEAVEAAVQDALMSGRCYEPSDGTLKSI